MTRIRNHKREILVLTGVFIVAFLVRAIGIDRGIPSQNHVYSLFYSDELAVLDASLSLGNREYAYVLLYYPFFYYLSFLAFVAYYLFSVPGGQFTGWRQFYAQYLRDSSDYLLYGRYWSVFLASLSVLATYFVSKRMFGKKTGFLATLFLLFSFGHIAYSRIFRLDVFLPLILLIAFYLILDAVDEREGRLRPFVLTGITIGVAGATKVTGWAVLIPYLLVGFTENGKFTIKPLKTFRFDRRWVYSLFVAAAVYIMFAAPGLTDLPDVLQRATSPIRRSAHVAGVQGLDSDASQHETNSSGRLSGVTASDTAELRFVNAANLSPYSSSFRWHVTHILPRALGWTIYIPAVAGLVLMLFNKERRTKVVLYVALMTAYLVPIGFASRTAWRDILPMLPFLCISAGYAVQLFLTWLLDLEILRSRPMLGRLLVGFFVILLLLLPGYDIYRQKKLITATDTRDVAKSWIEANVDEGTAIGTENYGPGIVDEETWQKKLAYAQLMGIDVPDRAPEAPSYRVYELVTDLSLGKDTLEPERVLTYLEENEVEYVVLSSGYYGRFYNEAIDLHSPQQAIRGRAFHDAIAANLEPVRQFMPDWETRPGPVIHIYRVPDDLDTAAPDKPGAFEPFAGLEPPASSVGDFQFSPR